jgi:hypothetical protein
MRHQKENIKMALVKCVFLFVLHALFCSTLLHGMENVDNTKALITTVPRDIQQIISTHSFDTSHSQYDMRSVEQEEILLIPSTLRPINLVKQMNLGTKNPDDIIPKPGEQCFLDTQLWVKRWGQKVRRRWLLDNAELRLDQDSVDTDDNFRYSFLGQSQDALFFDGINAHRRAVFAATNNEHYAIFWLTQSQDGAGTVQHSDVLNHCAGEGRLYSLMLHQECNRIVYTADRTQKSISEKTMAPASCSIVVVNVKKDEEKWLICPTFTTVNRLITKIIPVSSSEYIGLTDNGELARLQRTKENTMECIVQKHNERFFDIAVDASVQTADGFKPQIACLTRKGKLFVANMLAFAKPTLFLVEEEIPTPAVASALFYDRGNLAVLYQDSTYPNPTAPCWGDFLVWPDNFGALWLKKKMGLTKAIHNE